MQLTRTKHSNFQDKEPMKKKSLNPNKYCHIMYQGNLYCQIQRNFGNNSPCFDALANQSFPIKSRDTLDQSEQTYRLGSRLLPYLTAVGQSCQFPGL